MPKMEGTVTISVLGHHHHHPLSKIEQQKEVTVVAEEVTVVASELGHPLACATTSSSTPPPSSSSSTSSSKPFLEATTSSSSPPSPAAADHAEHVMEEKQHKKSSVNNISTAAVEYLPNSATSSCCSSAASSCSSSASAEECQKTAAAEEQSVPPAKAAAADSPPPPSPSPPSIWVMPAATRPDAKWKVRNLGLLAAILPGIGCYICLAYTFVFQFDKISNFTIPSTYCPGLKSMFPPISYSIGVWKPQKYIWMMILSLHMPPRFFYTIVHKNHYSLGQSEFRARGWFPKIERLHYVLLVSEPLGLLAVSIIDIESHFKIHAFCFAIWLTSFNFNMLFNNILHYHSGICTLKPMHERVFRIKCGLFLIGYPLSVSTGVSYATFVIYCNTTAYATFSLAETILVGINSLFYFLLVWEFEGSKVEVYIKHKWHHDHHRQPPSAVVEDTDKEVHQLT